MTNAFEASISALVESGERLSAVIREFADAFDSYDRETAQLIREIADVQAETEYNGGSIGEEEEEDEE